MNAIDILKKDHQAVLDVLQTILNSKLTAVRTREKLIKKLYFLVELHFVIAEKLIYPIELACPELEKLTRGFFVKHEAVSNLLKEALEVEVNEEDWLLRCSAIKEHLESHIEEEEKNLFPILNRFLSEENLKDIGNKILTLKQKRLIE